MIVLDVVVVVVDAYVGAAAVVTAMNTTVYSSLW